MTKEKISDSWQTPQDLFDELNEEFGPFDIDICATKENSKCEYYGEDYLNNIYLSKRGIYMYLNEFKTCFMNPPYSNHQPFIEKAWEDSKYCKIVCLVKCDPSTKWWSTFWEYNEVFKTTKDTLFSGTEVSFTGLHSYNGPKPGCEVRFFPKRIKFDPPQELINSGEVWKHYLICKVCKNTGEAFSCSGYIEQCFRCKGINENRQFKWVQKCGACAGTNYIWEEETGSHDCDACKGKGYKELSGPTFSSALLIFDRRLS